jgi:hypothetical protein
MNDRKENETTIASSPETTPHGNHSPSAPHILFASDNHRVAGPLHRSLQQAGFHVQLAQDYYELESLWQQHRHRVVLIEVSSLHSIEAAVDVAMRLKRHDANQFVGYLADPILRTSGLAGDAIFPRNSPHLSQALREHFGEDGVGSQ